MTRRGALLCIASALIPAPAQARHRYRVYRRKRTPVAQEPAPRTVSTIRIIPLPSKIVPTFHDHWMERIGWWLK